jgi:hypothetical protein
MNNYNLKQYYSDYTLHVLLLDVLVHERFAADQDRLSALRHNFSSSSYTCSSTLSSSSSTFTNKYICLSYYKSKLFRSLRTDFFLLAASFPTWKPLVGFTFLFRLCSFFLSTSFSSFLYPLRFSKFLLDSYLFY